MFGTDVKRVGQWMREALESADTTGAPVAVSDSVAESTVSRSKPAWARVAVDKLPIVACKDVRDNFDSKLVSFTDQLKEIFGSPFEVVVPLMEIYPYAAEGSTFGKVIASYIDQFISVLEEIAFEDDPDGKIAQKVTLTVNPQGIQANEIDCDILEGVFRILFSHDEFGKGISGLSECIFSATESASTGAAALQAAEDVVVALAPKVAPASGREAWQRPNSWEGLGQSTRPWTMSDGATC